MYRYLVNQIAVPLNKSMWKLRLPLSNKIFNWFVLKEERGHLQGYLLGSFLELLQKANNETFMKWACRALETMSMEVFAKHGWPSFKRI
ncbi:hypothetical protein U9M48_040735, partial [Paspalum notatum var. saurae]